MNQSKLSFMVEKIQEFEDDDLECVVLKIKHVEERFLFIDIL